LLLLDSAHIQESDVRYVNKKRRERGEKPKSPVYTTADAQESMRCLEPVRYAKKLKLGKFQAVLHDAGHILGSSMVDIEVEGKRVLFTGDLGRKKMPIIRDPVQVSEVDYLIMEATYGDRLHGDYSRVSDKLARAVRRAYDRGGRVVIPAFAVERSQELVYTFNGLRNRGLMPDMPVYVDSPLASRVTEVFRRYVQYYDAEANNHLLTDPELFDFPGLRYVESAEESKELNRMTEPCIIISASGMCEAGRVLHHLKHSVEHEKNMVLLVSFQAENTLGRRIAERQPRVRIYGDEFDLRCEVVVMDEFSAHADRSGLLHYVSRMNLPRLKKAFLVHSEPEAAEALVQPLLDMGVRDVYIPEVGDEYEI
ncbi:MAG: MBL fold metallo-hydrolase, partial [candidate division WOR-3 bacterium]